MRSLPERPQCHIGAVRIELDHAKRRIKKETRRKIRLIRFDQNLQISIDEARLPQLAIKLNSRLLTEGLRARVQLGRSDEAG